MPVRRLQPGSAIGAARRLAAQTAAATREAEAEALTTASDDVQFVPARADREVSGLADEPSAQVAPATPRRTLWLLRHGQAQSPPGLPDAQRPLTSVGADQAADAGVRLRAYAPSLAVVLTSPRLRARTTAEIAVRSHRGALAPVVFEELGGDYSTKELLAWIAPWLADEARATGDAARSYAAPAHVVIVGHNPTLAEIAQDLTGDVRGLSPGTLVAIDLDRGTLLHHLRASSKPE